MEHGVLARGRVVGAKTGAFLRGGRRLPPKILRPNAASEILPVRHRAAWKPARVPRAGFAEREVALQQADAARRVVHEVPASRIVLARPPTRPEGGRELSKVFLAWRAAEVLVRLLPAAVTSAVQLKFHDCSREIEGTFRQSTFLRIRQENTCFGPSALFSRALA